MKSVARCAALLPCLIRFSTGTAEDDWARRCKNLAVTAEGDASCGKFAPAFGACRAAGCALGRFAVGLGTRYSFSRGAFNNGNSAHTA
jgi:hypothetical protein